MVGLNETTLTLHGLCDQCGGLLYDLEIEMGEAACSECEQIETFDPKPFIEFVTVLNISDALRNPL